MPELQPYVWALIAGGVMVVVILVAVAASRRGREKVEQEQRVRRSQTFRVISIVVLLAVIVGFAFVNAQSVTVDWIFARTTAPLVLVVGLSGFMGFLIGALVAYRSKSD